MEGSKTRVFTSEVKAGLSPGEKRTSEKGKEGRRFCKTRALEGVGLLLTQKANQLGITPQTCLWSLGHFLFSR